QKDLITEEDLFAYEDGDPQRPVVLPRAEGARPSASWPVFAAMIAATDAGAVVHTHAVSATLASLAGVAFRIRALEMLKGLRGYTNTDELLLPIVDNAPDEAALAEPIAQLLGQQPGLPAVLVRGHGVYLWGQDWAEAKVQAECLHVLFEIEL